MATTPTSRRVTANDVARAAGVSRATVGFVLNSTPGQTISPATQEAVRAQAERLGYRPHPHARALVSGESRIVLLLLPEYPVEHNLSQMLSEASIALDQAGYSLVTTDPRHLRAARPLWETLQPDVVISLDPIASERRHAIVSGGARVIAAQDLAGPVEAVESDVIQGPAVQVEYLVERGHSRLAFASTANAAMRAMTVERQSLAASTAMALGAELIAETVPTENATQIVSGWRLQGVTAVAAFNDDVAAIVIGAALRLGLKVPEDLAVVGHDDTPLARLMVPSITTVHVDTSGLGRFFALVALNAAQGLDHPSMPLQLPRARLVVRESA